MPDMVATAAIKPTALAAPANAPISRQRTKGVRVTNALGQEVSLQNLARAAVSKNEAASRDPEHLRRHKMALAPDFKPVAAAATATATAATAITPPDTPTRAREDAALEIPRFISLATTEIDTTEHVSSHPDTSVSVDTPDRAITRLQYETSFEDCADFLKEQLLSHSYEWNVSGTSWPLKGSMKKFILALHRT